jgi:hypothetical protein
MGHIYWNDSSRLFDSGETIDVLALGDSWFHYPFNNLITPLYTALDRPTVYVIGESGARADELCQGSWLGNFRRMLGGYPSIRLVCISAGGNDFAGIGDLDDKILASDCSNATSLAECYRAAQPQGVFASSLATIDVPRFTPGERVVLFLYPESRLGLTSPVGLGQGRLSILRDKQGQDVAASPLGNRELLRGLSADAGERLGPEVRQGGEQRMLPLGSLLDGIRRLSHDGRAGADEGRP